MAVIAYTRAGFDWLRKHLTAATVQQYFAALRPSRVVRYEAPNLLALNFVLHDILAGGASRLVRHFLYGATSGDGVLYAGAAVVVTAAALGACWVLARRAARLDPVAALRAE